MAKKPNGFRAFDKLARKLAQVPPLREGMRVELIGEHPQAGLRGVIFGTALRIRGLPSPRWIVKFDAGSEVKECFACETEMERLD